MLREKHKNAKNLDQPVLPKNKSKNRHSYILKMGMVFVKKSILIL